MNNVVAIAAGRNHRVAVKNDGSVWVWGSCSYGVDGYAGDTYRVTPINVEGISNVVSVAAGNYFVMALCQDGSVWTWGNNQSGQLGLGSVDAQSHPIPQRVPGLSDIVSIDTLFDHATAVDRQGKGWVWGNNAYGKLGLGVNDGRVYASPQSLSSLKRIKSMICCDVATLALGWDGRVWGWGFNQAAQLGLGVEGMCQVYLHPQLIMDDPLGVFALWGGDWHAMAVLHDGRVYGWGGIDNPEMGRLGTAVRPVLIEGWTVYPYTSNPRNKDSDADGILDGVEIAYHLNPMVPDEGVGDSDHDGLQDFEEAFYGTDKHDADSDDDGLSDGLEIDYGLNPLLDNRGLDSDKDGVNDIDEIFLYGTNPLVWDRFAAPKAAMWVWSMSEDIVMETHEYDREDFYSFVAAPHGDVGDAVETLFMSIPPEVIETSPAKVREFIADAHSRGLKIEFLSGDPTWALSMVDEYTGLPYNQPAMEVLQLVLDFNAASSPEERFDGVQYDVEPYLLNDDAVYPVIWENAYGRAIIWEQYCASLVTWQGMVDDHNTTANDYLRFGRSDSFLLAE